MSYGFDSVKKKYSESFQQHGDSPASLLTPKGKHNLRFRVLDQFRDSGAASILDYGCGLGYLYEYVSERLPTLSYTGMDILPEFISACQSKYPSIPFLEIEPEELLEEKYDIIFSSGVFNLSTDADSDVSKGYAFDRLSHLYDSAKQVLVCDFLSAEVDFQQDGAQHFSVGELADFCFKNLSRRFQIRHDLLPYELTVIVFKEAGIGRPDNIYELDL